jgi:hypothetical protein
MAKPLTIIDCWGFFDEFMDPFFIICIEDMVEKDVIKK